MVVVDKDPLKIILFSLGTLVGSYSGSVIEEKLSLGKIIIITIINNSKYNLIKNELKKYEITCINSDDKKIMFIELPKKQRLNTINIIKEYDNNSKIIEIKEKS